MVEVSTEPQHIVFGKASHIEATEDGCDGCQHPDTTIIVVCLHRPYLYRITLAGVKRYGRVRRTKAGWANHPPAGIWREYPFVLAKDEILDMSAIILCRHQVNKT